MKCKARAKRTGQQCKKNAVTGYAVCASHGAGTRKRVREGKRKSPAFSSIRTGEYVSPKTEKIRQIYDPDYARCLQEVEQDPRRLMNLDEMAKRIYATLRSYDFREMPAEDRDKAFMDIAFAVSRVEQVRLGFRMKQMEEFQPFVEAIVKLLEEVIPGDRLEYALNRLAALTGVGGRSLGATTKTQGLLPNSAQG